MLLLVWEVADPSFVQVTAPLTDLYTKSAPRRMVDNPVPLATAVPGTAISGGGPVGTGEGGVFWVKLAKFTHPSVVWSIVPSD